mgnify:CR=1 FL=1
MCEIINEYNIVCITDDLYAQHTGVMIASLLVHSSKPCRIFVLTNSLTEDNKNKLKSVVEQSQYSTIQFIEEYDARWTFKEFSTGENIKKWNSIMYLKLFMPLLLPSTLNRVLFLDGDIIINSDIKDLYGMDLKKCVIAAAEDWKYCYFHKERIGLLSDECYINSGVMVINIEAWRNLEKRYPIMTFMIKYKDIIINDQDVFALYFKNYIQYISQKWNVTTYYFERKPRINDKFLMSLNEIRETPLIIHFCEPIKPWFKECRHPYRKLYKKYLKQTPWNNYKFLSCGSHLGKPAWRYVVKHWLNRMNLRHDDWAMVKINSNYEK